MIKKLGEKFKISKKNKIERLFIVYNKQPL